MSRNLPRLLSTLARWIAYIYFSILLASATIVLLPEPDAEPLIPKADFQIDGAWAQKIYPSEIEVRESVRQSAERAFFRSHPKINGRVVTSPFTPPRFATVPLYGYPFDALNENHLYLECAANGRRMDLARANTNTQWTEVVLSIEPDWCPDQVTMIAEATSRYRLMGAGSPFAVSRISYLKTRGIGQVIIHFVIFVALFSIGFAAVLVCRKVGLSIPRFATFLIGIGMLGYMLFFVMDLSARAGEATALLLLGAAPATIVYLYVTDRRLVKQSFYALRGPFAAWFIGSLGLVLLLYSDDNGGGSWRPNYRFAPVNWSSDNQLSLFISEALADGRDMSQFTIGQWQVSDRPPLLTGIVCLLRPLLLVFQTSNDGPHLYYNAYHIAGILANSLWLPILFFVMSKLSRQSRFDNRLALLACGLTPLALFNTIYIWPKMLAGGFGLMAFHLILSPRSDVEENQEQAPDRHSLPLAAVFSAFSLLSHGAGVFAICIMLLWALVSRTRPGIKQWLIAGLLGLMILVPWLLWQKQVQPPGNALVKYTFAGTFGFDDRETSVLETVTRAYSKIDLPRWLEMRQEAVSLLLGNLRLESVERFQIANYTRLGEDWLDLLRLRDFYFLLPAMGVFLAPAVFLGAMAWWRRKTLPPRSQPIIAARRMLGVSLATYTASIFLFWNAHLTFTLGYVAHLLLMLGAFVGLWALGQVIAARFLAAASILYSLLVWIVDPLIGAFRVDWLAVSMLVLCLLVITVWTFRTEERAASHL